NRLWVDENLHVQLMSNGKKISMDQVSRGTLEQIYFAIRMAATKILHEEECPVILDDVFGYYDDSRLAQTLRWLKDSKRQVIIFSCQKREMEMLEKMGCEYHKVML
ncbi:ATP-binding protein, partial [Coprococcus comes]